MGRDKWIHIKLTANERKSWQVSADAQGLTVADLVRQRMGTALVERAPVRKRQVKRVDPSLIRELAKIGNNLNQLARWANTYKSAADAVQIIAGLAAIDRALGATLSSVLSSKN